MGTRDERDRILSVLEKLRSITLAVQVIPFAYTGLYIMTLSMYLIAPEGVLTALDSLFYVFPVIVAAFLVESRILKLCGWHKTACLLPLIPQISVAIDRYIRELPLVEVYIHCAIIILMSVLLLVAAYKVFLSPKRDGRKKRTDRDT